MNAEKTLMTHTELVQAVTAAAVKALKAGMTKDTVQAVLTNLAEMLDSAEDD